MHLDCALIRHERAWLDRAVEYWVSVFRHHPSNNSGSDEAMIGTRRLRLALLMIRLRRGAAERRCGRASIRLPGAARRHDRSFLRTPPTPRESPCLGAALGGLEFHASLVRCRRLGRKTIGNS